MSCIYGKLNFNRKPINAIELGTMRNTLNHWGADDIGVWYSGSIGMGHLMLWNTPESLTEKLPLYQNHNQLTITADARIDNRDELFTKLSLPKAEAHLIADSSLILKAYEKYGDECVLHLIGDFAFAIWDETEQKLFCARDHMGVKPFFYYKDERFFAFASEARGLLVIDGVNKAVNETYFLKLVANLQPEKPETAYQCLYRLDNATALIIKDKVIRVKKYWELDANREVFYKDKKDYIENFRALFKQAVACRLRSSYLIGTELSGGLDSSGISAVAANLLHAQGKKITGFISMPGSKDLYKDPLETEEAHADEVVDFSGIDSVYKNINNAIGRDFLEEIDTRLSVYGYPCFNAIDWNSDFYKTAYSMQIRTMLSGHGGDQLITDFSKNYILQYINNKQYKTYFNIALKEWGLKKSLMKLVTTQAKQPLPLYVTKIMEYRMRKRLKYNTFNFLAPEYLTHITADVKFKGFLTTFREIQKQNPLWDFVSERMEFETLNGLKYKICPVFPMQDVRLMEYVLALPTEEKMEPGRDRLIYRRAMEGLMPQRVVNRKSKHINAIINPKPAQWLKRQPDVKNWILTQKNNNLIPAYLNYDEFIKRYAWEAESTVDFNQLLTPKLRQIELIIRWLQINT